MSDHQYGDSFDNNNIEIIDTIIADNGGDIDDQYGDLDLEPDFEGKPPSYNDGTTVEEGYIENSTKASTGGNQTGTGSGAPLNQAVVPKSSSATTFSGPVITGGSSGFRGHGSRTSSIPNLIPKAAESIGGNNRGRAGQLSSGPLNCGPPINFDDSTLELCPPRGSSRGRDPDDPETVYTLLCTNLSSRLNYQQLRKHGELLLNDSEKHRVEHVAARMFRDRGAGILELPGRIVASRALRDLERREIPDTKEPRIKIMRCKLLTQEERDRMMNSMNPDHPQYSEYQTLQFPSQSAKKFGPGEKIIWDSDDESGPAIKLGNSKSNGTRDSTNPQLDSNGNYISAIDDPQASVFRRRNGIKRDLRGVLLRNLSKEMKESFLMTPNLIKGFKDADIRRKEAVEIFVKNLFTEAKAEGPEGDERGCSSPDGYPCKIDADGNPVVDAATEAAFNSIGPDGNKITRRAISEASRISTNPGFYLERVTAKVDWQEGWLILLFASERLCNTAGILIRKYGKSLLRQKVMEGRHNSVIGSAGLLKVNAITSDEVRKLEAFGDDQNSMPDWYEAITNLSRPHPDVQLKVDMGVEGVHYFTGYTGSGFGKIGVQGVQPTNSNLSSLSTTGGSRSEIQEIPGGKGIIERGLGPSTGPGKVLFKGEKAYIGKGKDSGKDSKGKGFGGFYSDKDSGKGGKVSWSEGKDISGKGFGKDKDYYSSKDSYGKSSDKESSYAKGSKDKSDSYSYGKSSSKSTSYTGSYSSSNGPYNDNSYLSSKGGGYPGMRNDYNSPSKYSNGGGPNSSSNLNTYQDNTNYDDDGGGRYDEQPPRSNNNNNNNSGRGSPKRGPGPDGGNNSNRDRRGGGPGGRGDENNERNRDGGGGGDRDRRGGGGGGDRDRERNRDGGGGGDRDRRGVDRDRRDRSRDRR